MVNKTFTKILSLGICIVLVTSLSIVGVYYSYYEKQAQSNLKSVAQIVAAQLNENPNYEAIEDGIDNDARLTVIASDGTVLADSIEEGADMENHSDRPEFKEALKSGEASTIRKSATLDANTYYFAKKLNNGDILRVAVTSQSIYMIFYNSLIIIAAIMLAVMIISLALSYAITKSIVKPITDLGQHFDEIDNYETYSELQPFVDSIKEQKKKQKLLDKQKKQFTANVSHELKTPLTSIAGYAELIENGMAKPEDIKPFAHTIRKQALRLVTLSEDIIQLSQLDEAEGEIVFEEIDLTGVAESCVSALEMNAKAKNVTITCKGKPCYIKANPSLIEELIYNLCDNAIRYNKDGGSVEVNVSDLSNSAVLSVSDTGIGIEKKYQSRIFERFFRVDKSRSKETGGTGLGLAIVKHITEVHGAQLDIQSTPDVGTTIQITFNKSA